MAYIADLVTITPKETKHLYVCGVKIVNADDTDYDYVIGYQRATTIYQARLDHEDAVTNTYIPTLVGKWRVKEHAVATRIPDDVVSEVAGQL